MHAASSSSAAAIRAEAVLSRIRAACREGVGAAAFAHPECGAVLSRIRACQDSPVSAASTRTEYDRALSEMRAGEKRSHFIWFVWPTLRGVRKTSRPDLELHDFSCACAYLRDETLAARLTAVTEAATSHLTAGVAPEKLFGAMHTYDAPKFHEACTLFAVAASLEAHAAAPVFFAGLDAIAGGALHEKTVEWIEKTAG